jgi:hypothetical protein
MPRTLGCQPCCDSSNLESKSMIWSGLFGDGDTPLSSRSSCNLFGCPSRQFRLVWLTALCNITTCNHRTRRLSLSCLFVEPLPLRHLETFGRARRLWNSATTSDTSFPSHQIPPEGGRPLHARLIRRAPLLLVRRPLCCHLFFLVPIFILKPPTFPLTVFLPSA